MARTDDDRYKQALDCIKAIDAALAAEVDQKIGHSTTAVGAKLSLAGAGYWRSGSAAQHTAVRALTLCHIAYFTPPHADKDYADATALAGVRANCLGRSLAEIEDELRLYLRFPNPTLEGLAAAATRVSDVIGVMERMLRKRTDTNVSANPICYDGVVSWLFAAGFISKRWLGRQALKMQASKANKYLGDGIVVDKDDWDSIPRGYIWNVHRTGDKETCHWGVSLGDGVAVACNNTDVSLTKQLDYINDEGARPGDTKYGKFLLADMCEVLNGHFKYGHEGKGKPTKMNIVLRKVNPLHVQSYN